MPRCQFLPAYALELAAQRFALGCDARAWRAWTYADCECTYAAIFGEN